MAASLLNPLEATHFLACLCQKRKHFKRLGHGGQGMLLKVWESIPNILSWLALGDGIVWL